MDSFPFFLPLFPQPCRNRLSILPLQPRPYRPHMPNPSPNRVLAAPIQTKPFSFLSYKKPIETLGTGGLSIYKKSRYNISSPSNSREFHRWTESLLRPSSYPFPYQFSHIKKRKRSSPSLILSAKGKRAEAFLYSLQWTKPAPPATITSKLGSEQPMLPRQSTVINIFGHYTHQPPFQAPSTATTVVTGHPYLD